MSVAEAGRRVLPTAAMRRLLCPWLALGLLTACPESCVHQTPASSHLQREELHAAAAQSEVSSKVPPHPKQSGTGIFGGEIAFVGYDVIPAVPRAGSPVEITFYFQALKDVTRDWEIFVHADDIGGREERISGDHFPGGGRFHTDQWRQGDYIADRFEITPPDYQAKSRIDLWMGFYQGEDRLPISNPAACTNDGNNRLLAGSLQIE